MLTVAAISNVTNANRNNQRNIEEDDGDNDDGVGVDANNKVIQPDDTKCNPSVVQHQYVKVANIFQYPSRIVDVHNFEFGL